MAAGAPELNLAAAHRRVFAWWGRPTLVTECHQVLGPPSRGSNFVCIASAYRRGATACRSFSSGGGRVTSPGRSVLWDLQDEDSGELGTFSGCRWLMLPPAARRRSLPGCCRAWSPARRRTCGSGRAGVSRFIWRWRVRRKLCRPALMSSPDIPASSSVLDLPECTSASSGGRVRTAALAPSASATTRTSKFPLPQPGCQRLQLRAVCRDRVPGGLLQHHEQFSFPGARWGAGGAAGPAGACRWRGHPRRRPWG
jgi:hypothetical protein